MWGAQVPSLVGKIPHTCGAAKKEKKRKERKMGYLVLPYSPEFKSSHILTFILQSELLILLLAKLLPTGVMFILCYVFLLYAFSPPWNVLLFHWLAYALLFFHLLISGFFYLLPDSLLFAQTLLTIVLLLVLIFQFRMTLHTGFLLFPSLQIKCALDLVSKIPTRAASLVLWRTDNYYDVCISSVKWR